MGAYRASQLGGVMSSECYELKDVACVVCGEDQALAGGGRPGLLCFICETVEPFCYMANPAEIQTVAANKTFCQVALAYHGGYLAKVAAEIDEIEPRFS